MFAPDTAANEATNAEFALDGPYLLGVAIGWPCHKNRRRFVLRMQSDEFGLQR